MSRAINTQEVLACNKPYRRIIVNVTDFNHPNKLLLKRILNKNNITK